MKKKKCLLGLFVPSLLLAVAGCAREEVGGKGETPADKISLTATIENVQADDVSKVDISTSSGAFTWTEGDQIAVHTSTPNWQTATLESGAGLASGVFTAQMNETDRNGYAIYPASVAGGTDAAPAITLPSEYTIDGSMGEYSPLPMIAVNAPNTTLAFKQVGAIFRITLEDVPAETKYIKVTTDLDIYGTFTVQNPSTAAPTIETSSSTGKNVVKFTFSNALTQKQNIVLNVPIPVCKNTVYSTLSVDMYNASDVILAGAWNDNVRAMTRASGRKVSMFIAPNNERIGSFSLSLENLSVSVGHSKTMNFTATALDGTTSVTPDNMTFSYSPTGIAIAAYSAGTLTIMGAAIGTTTLTVTAIKGTDQITKTATVKVVETRATVTDSKFRGFVISPGILKMTASNTFVLTDGTDPFEILNQYGTGLSASTYPRYYFRWDELKTYWGTRSQVILQINKPIDTVNSSGTTVSSAGWHVPTQENCNTIIAITDTGKGAYVNDDTKSNARRHWAKVYVDLTGSPYAGKGLSARSGTSPNYTYSTSVGSNYITGLLLFPDDAEVVCENLTIFDTDFNPFTNDVTYDDIMTLVNEGCLFLPCAGYGSTWSNGNVDRWFEGGTWGDYWLANAGYALGFQDSVVGSRGNLTTYSTAISGFLVRGDNNLVEGGAGIGGVILAPGNAIKSGSTWTNGASYLANLQYYNNEGSGGAPSTNPQAYFNTAVSVTAFNDSYGNGWRAPTLDELKKWIGETSRTGATITVYGSSNQSGKYYTKVKITGLNGIAADASTGDGVPASYVGYSATAGEAYLQGLLLFPDGATIYYNFANANDPDADYAEISKEDIDELIEEGCAFLPRAGYYQIDPDNWINNFYNFYRCSESTLLFEYGTVNNSYYCPVRLVRDYSE